MKLILEHDRFGNWVLRQEGGRFLRLALGLPLLLWGAVMLLGVFSSFWIQWEEKGTAGLPEVVVGSLVLLLFSALVLPLGWWLTLSTHSVTLEAGPQDIVAVSDWKIGRKESRTPAGAFQALRVAVEPLHSTPGRNSRGREVHCQKLRLLAKNPMKQPSLELGWLEPSEREQALALGRSIAEFLKVKLEVMDPDTVMDSPERERNEE